MTKPSVGMAACVAQWVKGAAHHILGEVLNVGDVLFGAAAVVDAGEGLLDPVPCPRGRECTSRMIRAGRRRCMVRRCELDDGDGLVEDDNAAGAEHGASLAHLVEVEAYVDLLRQEYRAGGAARDDGLELLAVLDAACYVVDGLLEVVAHGQLVDAGAPWTWPLMPKRRVPPLRSLPILAYSSPPIKRMWGAEAMVSALLMTAGATVKTNDGGEGRLRMRGTPQFAFERFHQGGLFAYFVGASAGLGGRCRSRGQSRRCFYRGSPLRRRRLRPFSTILRR